MIRLQITLGPAGTINPRKGTTCPVHPSTQPRDMLLKCAHKHYDWHVDYSEATFEEREVWGHHDFICRILRAQQDGRTYWLNDVQYSSPDFLWDAMTRKTFRIVTDDTNGIHFEQSGFIQ